VEAPLQHVFAIEELTDISREYLRPDFIRSTHRKPAKGKRQATNTARGQ
jgi:hypothetical protein